MRKMKTYGGMFRASDLDKLVICSVPVTIIVHTDDHWMAVYISSKTVEVMDSLGLCRTNINKKIINFICSQIQSKSFYVTPKLQTNDSTLCALYCILFVKLKEDGFTFEKILALFS